MPNGPILELAPLPLRHPPIGEALLHEFGPAAIIRLCTDPTPQAPGTMSRGVEVNWLPRPGNNVATQVHRDIGWTGLQSLQRVCIQLPLTVNGRTLTEKAAIGVVA